MSTRINSLKGKCPKTKRVMYLPLKEDGKLLKSSEKQDERVTQMTGDLLAFQQSRMNCGNPQSKGDHSKC